MKKNGYENLEPHSVTFQFDWENKKVIAAAMSSDLKLMSRLGPLDFEQYGWPNIFGATEFVLQYGEIEAVVHGTEEDRKFVDDKTKAEMIEIMAQEALQYIYDRANATEFVTTRDHLVHAMKIPYAVAIALTTVLRLDGMIYDTPAFNDEGYVAGRGYLPTKGGVELVESWDVSDGERDDASSAGQGGTRRSSTPDTPTS